MDISAIANTALAQTQVDGGQVDIQNTMLRKALDQQASTAAQLIAAVPAPATLATEGPVGTRINTLV